MITTPRRIIIRSLKDLGVVGQGAVPTDEEIRDGHDLLRQWLDAAKIERLYIVQVVRSVFPLTSDVASYTIGDGGDFDVSRPQWIDAARVYPSSDDVHYALEVVNLDRYRRISRPSLAGAYPRKLYYDRGYDATGLGTITVHPVQDVAGVRIALFLPTPIDTFDTLDTEYDLPPGYYRLLRLALALEMAPTFAAVDPSVIALLREQLTDARSAVMSANAPERELGMDPAISGQPGTFDIELGDYE